MIQQVVQNRNQEEELVFPHKVHSVSYGLRFSFKFLIFFVRNIKKVHLPFFSVYVPSNTNLFFIIPISSFFRFTKNISFTFFTFPIFQYHKIMRKNKFKYFSILNNNSKMSNRKTPNFATQLFLRKRDLICVKEFAYSSPKFFPSEKTFLNANIICNLKKCPPQCFAEVSGSGEM